MVRIEYKRSKALLVFGFFGVCALLFAWIFVSPEDFAHIRRARWLSGDLGRWVFLPIFLLSSGILALRAAMIVVGDNLALEMTSTHLRLNGFWGCKQVRWSDVRGVKLEGNTGAAQLAVMTRTSGDFGNGKIRLPLGLAGLSEGQILGLLSAIDERRKTPTGADGHFARTQAGGSGDGGPTAPITAAGPSFGRKQI